MDITSQWFNYLHTQRKLTHEIIKMAGLDVSNGLLKIPVYNESGEIIFHKYRKSPWDSSNSPKYQYEKGARVSLYGIDHLGSEMIVCEGELDALALLSCGFNACTSTGGALSFQEEWVPLFENRRVTIMFDNDEAGISGAVKTAFMFKKFTYRWVPPRYGKDVSDVLMNYDAEMLKVLMRNPDNAIEIEIPNFKTKKEMHEYRRALATRTRTMSSGSIGTLFIRAIIVELSVRLAEKKRKPVQKIEGSNIEQARAYPIVNLIEVNRDGFALCVTHSEKTPSLKVYKDNHAYCFGGCGKRLDAIGIAMAVWSCDFKSAVERLTQ